MATIKILLNDTYADKDGLFPIIMRVEHRGRRRKIPIGYKIEEKYWADGKVKNTHPKATLINAAIADKEAEARRYLADCQLHGKPIHLQLIGTGRTSYSFTDYLRHRAEQYRAAGKIVMGRKVDRFVRELVELAGEVYFEDVDLDFLRRLEQSQIENGNVENTRHKKFKFLSQYYSHAMAEGKAPSPNPFKPYKIATTPAKKDKLTEGEIKAIEDLEIPNAAIALARDLFLFSYYAKGQRFETCITMKRDQVRNGRIYFRTNKGKDYISVKIHDRLQAILNRYDGDSELLFPYLESIPGDPAEYLRAIGSGNTIFNMRLKVVATFAGIKTKLTFHIARHSFAYHLKKVSDNVNVIQDALGHSDQKTTQIYLKSLEDDRLDKEMEKLYGQ